MIQVVEKLTPVNHWTGRRGQRVGAIVLHISDVEGSPVGWFHDARSEVSSNYVVERDGTIVRVVAEADAAWANGWAQALGLERYLPNLSNPVIAGWWWAGVNPNLATISIEMQGRPGQAFPYSQWRSLVWLVADVARRHGLPLDREHVIGHYEIDSVTRSRCPSLTAGQWRGLLQEAGRVGDVSNGHDVGEGMRWALERLGDVAAGDEVYHEAPGGGVRLSTLETAAGRRLAWLALTGKVYELQEVR